MKYLEVFPYYLSWHYGRGIKEIINAFKNFLFFVPVFFSVGNSLKNLFAPFQRLKEHHGGTLEIEKFFEVLAFNFVARVFGFFVRSFFIILGLISFVLTFIVELALFIFWLFLPLLVLLAITWSITTITYELS